MMDRAAGLGCIGALTIPSYPDDHGKGKGTVASNDDLLDFLIDPSPTN